MAAELHVNDSSTWRKAKAVSVNDSSVWTDIKEAYVNDGGTWRSVFVYGPTAASLSAIDARSEQEFPTDAYASIRVSTDGAVYEQEGTTAGAAFTSLFTWYTDTDYPTSDFEVMLDTGGSGVSSGDAANTWLSLGSTRTWTNSMTGVGSVQDTGTLYIRAANSQVVLASASFTLRASSVSP